MNAGDTFSSLSDLWERGSLSSDERSVGFYPEILEILAGATAADRASLLVPSPDREALVIEASIGLPQEVPAKTRVPLGKSISGWVATHGRPLLLCPDQELPEAVLDAMLNPSISSALSVPITLGDKGQGVLNLARCSRDEQFDYHHIQVAMLAGLTMGTFLRTSDSGDSPAGTQSFLSRVLENMPSSTVIVDRRLRVVAANQAFLASAQLTRKATAGLQLADVIPGTLLDQTGAIEKIERVFCTGSGLEAGKVAYQTPGVPMRIYLVRFAPVASEAGGRVENVTVIMEDITEVQKLNAEARQAERDLLTMKASEQDLVIWLDRGGRVVSWNPAAEAMTGRVLSEVQGKSMAELCAGDDRAVCRGALRHVAAGSYVRGLEMLIIGPEQRNVAVSWHCSPVGDDDGKIAGMVAVGRDLTEHRQLEQLLIQSDKLASLGVMAGGIAHELRNPLTIITVSAELAQAAPDDLPLRTECLEKIGASAKRASLVIESLLKFARPQSDAAAVVVDVKELLEATFSFTSDQLALHWVRPYIEAEDNRAKVLGSPVLLQQVFINLILNACAAMPRGGDLVASAKSCSDGMVRISFRDTGEGIFLENLPKLFDPFFTTRPPGNGSVGLGLSITYSIVKRLGGSIEVESAPGRGSTFTVALPRVLRRGK